MRKNKTVKYEETNTKILNRAEAKSKNCIHAIETRKEDIDRKFVKKITAPDGKIFSYVDKGETENLKDDLFRIKSQIDELDDFNCKPEDIKFAQGLFNTLIRQCQDNFNEIKTLKIEGASKLHLSNHYAVHTAFILGQELMIMKYGDHVKAAEVRYESEVNSREAKLKKSEPLRNKYLSIYREGIQKNLKTPSINKMFRDWCWQNKILSNQTRERLADGVNPPGCENKTDIPRYVFFTIIYPIADRIIFPYNCFH